MFWGKTLLFLEFCSVAVFCFSKIDKKCKANDVECLTNMGKILFQKVMSGDAELGIESLDPLYEKLIEVNIPTIKYRITDANVTGLSQSVVKEVSIRKPKTLHMTFLYPVYHLRGQYEIDGAFLGLPLQGKGTCIIDATNTEIEVQANKQYTEKDGKTYFKFKSFTLKTKLLGDVHTDVENFTGVTKDEAEKILAFINSNAKDLVDILGTPLQISHMKRIIKNMNKLFENVAVEDILEKD